MTSSASKASCDLLIGMDDLEVEPAQGGVVFYVGGYDKSWSCVGCQ